MTSSARSPTAPPCHSHLNDVASDFVNHYHQRWRLMATPSRAGESPRYGGNAKALLVCIDKRIQDSWTEKRQELVEKLQQEEAHFAQAGKPETEWVARLRAQVAWTAETQIHPVFSA